MSKRPLLTVFMIVLVDLIGYGILIPVIPELFTEGGSHLLMPGNAWFEANKYILLAVLTALYPIGQFLAAPILGQLSDRYGRKSILAISIAGTSASYVLFALGIFFRSLPLLLASRALDGLTGGNIATAQAVVADISPPDKRQKNFGMLGAAFGLGFILGPALGGILASSEVVSWFSVTTPFLFAAMLSLLNVIMVLTLLPETHPSPHKGRVINLTQSFRNITKVFTFKSVTPLFITGFLLQSGFAFYTTFAAIYLSQRFGFTEKNVGVFFALVGVWIVITQGIILRSIAGKVADYKIVRVSLFAISLALAVYPLVSNATLMYGFIPFYAVPLGLANATITGIVSKSVGPHIQGEILGVNASVLAIAQAAPPLIAGLVASSLSPAASISVAAVLVLSSAIYFFNVYKPHTAKTSSPNPEGLLGH